MRVEGRETHPIRERSAVQDRVVGRTEHKASPVDEDEYGELAGGRASWRERDVEVAAVELVDERLVEVVARRHGEGVEGSVWLRRVPAVFDRLLFEAPCVKGDVPELLAIPLAPLPRLERDRVAEARRNGGIRHTEEPRELRVSM